MRINRIEIAGFGKLSDYVLDLKEGFQVVYGANEYGKSTIMEFLKIMFYGDQGKNINGYLRETRAPWSGGALGGALEFTCGGFLYRLQKEIDAKTPVKDKVTFRNKSLSKDVALGKKEEIGKKLFGLELRDFQRSAYIGDVGRIEVDGVKESGNCLLNLITCGDEKASKDKAEERLNAAVKELKWKNGAGGKVVRLENEVRLLSRRLEEAKLREIEREKLRARLADVQGLIEERENLRKILERERIAEKLDAITNVINMMEERDDYASRLARGGDSVNDGIKIILQSREEKKVIDRLTADVSSFNDAIRELENSGEAVTERDLARASALNEEARTYGEALSELERIISQENEEFKNRNSAYHEKVRELGELERKLAELGPRAERFEELRSELETVSSYKSGLEENGRVIRREINGYRGEIEAISRRLKEVESKTIKSLAISGAAALISTAAFVYFKIWGGASAIVAFYSSYVLYSFMIYRKSRRDLDSLKDKEKSAVARLESEVSLPYEAAEAKESKLHGDLSELRPFLDERISLKEGVVAKQNELRIEEISLERAKNGLKNRVDGFLKKFKIGEKADEKIDVKIERLSAAEEIRINIEALKRRLIEIREEKKAQVKKEMEEKGCLSFDEYRDRRAVYLKIERLIKLRAEKIRALDLRKSSFMDKMKNYGNFSNYQEACYTFNAVNGYLVEFEQKDGDVKTGVKLCGFENMDLKDLKNAADKLKTFNESYRRKSDEELESIKSRLKILENDNLQAVADDIKSRLSVPYENVLTLEKRLCEKKGVLKSAKSYLKSLEIAGSVLSQAAIAVKEGVGPLLNERASKIFNGITLGKYRDMEIYGNYDVSVKVGAFLRRCEVLSSGTIDQAYLSLRLALSEIISGRTPTPVLLDDVLTRYDDQRLESAMNYMKKYSESKGPESQIILFTCHGYLASRAEAMGVPVFRGT